MEAGRAFRHPAQEFFQPGVAAQCLDRVIVTGKLGFGQGGVDFIVADLVQQYRRPALAAFESWHKVVQALPGLRRDRALAQGADRIGQGE